MALTAKEAAEQVGMSKQGLLKAVRLGKLSATKNMNGEWEFDAAELFRVYEPKKNGHLEIMAEAGSEISGLQIESLQREIGLLREMLIDKDETIRDLRGRLDRETQEREKLTVVLTEEHHSQQNGRLPIWRRLLGS